VAPTPCDTNGAALYTAGSFRFDGVNAVGGDDYASEPETRLSDELFFLDTSTYALADLMVLVLSGDKNEAGHAVVIALGVGADFDCDEIDNDVDVCPAIADATQDDLDDDGIGGACDDDDVVVVDASDNCPVLANADQEDTDLDDAGDGRRRLRRLRRRRRRCGRRDRQLPPRCKPRPGGCGRRQHRRCVRSVGEGRRWPRWQRSR